MTGDQKKTERYPDLNEGFLHVWDLLEIVKVHDNNKMLNIGLSVFRNCNKKSNFKVMEELIANHNNQSSS